jgi:7,8-dihydropterin-6-yl-methyl-4-(beta-D-ribofuranosyl)aminobenzene 5'-phosphate synthase
MLTGERAYLQSCPLHKNIESMKEAALFDTVIVRVLVNNVVEETKLLAEHGLSLLVSFAFGDRQGKVLLDTGQTGEVLMKNIETLGIPLDDLLAVVISHGHYDHTGGLLRLMSFLRRPVKVVIHPDA